jgi:hypothetical protein
MTFNDYELICLGYSPYIFIITWMFFKDCSLLSSMACLIIISLRFESLLTFVACFNVRICSCKTVSVLLGLFSLGNVYTVL